MYNKNMADRTLAAVFLLFLFANVVKYYYREAWLVDWFRFITEAALVGGVADWFAVTAIFRKPLGFPWHTALIPRHRKRVIAAIADMVEKELLSPASIKKRIAAVALVDKGIAWVEEQRGRQTLKKAAEGYIPLLLGRLDLTALELKVWMLIQGRLAPKGSVSPYIKKGAAWLLEKERYETAAAWAVGKSLELLESGAAKQEIYNYLLNMKQAKTKTAFEKFFFWLGEQTDSINLEEASQALYDKLLVFVRGLQNPDHEMHKWIKGKLLQLVEEDRWAQQAESWKEELLTGIHTSGITRDMLLAGLTALRGNPSLVVNWFSHHLEMYWEQFKNNPTAQVWLEERIKSTLYRLVDSEQHFIGVMVRNVLDSFSDEDLNRFVEEKAGEDLQWIRMNGCLVGAAAGAVLFLLLRFVYQPLLQIGW